MKRVGIFGGSFNPVHNGHLILADYIRRHAQLDEIWFVLSPLNPLKENPGQLLPDDVRFDMLRIAVEPYAPHFKACDIELSMPRPSYTVDTLRELRRLHPGISLTLIIGADNYASFDRWKEPGKILEMAHIAVYPRPGTELPAKARDGVSIVDAPLVDISSTMIRNMVAEGSCVNNLIPAKVLEYIEQHQLYIK